MLESKKTIVILLSLAMALLSCQSARETATAPASWYPEQILSLQERQQEAQTKLDRVLELVKREQLAGILINTVRNFAWITAGGDSHIVITSENGAVPLFIGDDGRKFFITSNSEAPRMLDEDLKGMGYEWKKITWFGDKVEPNQLVAAVQELTGGRAFGSDSSFPGARLIDEDLAALRVPLTDTEIRKFRWLGKKCGEAVNAVCRQIQPGMTERGIEALVSDALLRHAIRPTVLLIAADDRIFKYRHAPPSDHKKLEKYGMVNICARRWGLVIAMTRFVHFGPVPADLQKKLAAAARVNAGFWARTVPGASAAAILEGAIADYTEAGYPGEWQEHHQGGAIGYQERDWVAVPGSKHLVHDNEAFAWNPTVQGAKIEDTVLLLRDRLEILTEIPGWPMVESEVLGRKYRSPAILVR